MSTGSEFIRFVWNREIVTRCSPSSRAELPPCTTRALSWFVALHQNRPWTFGCYDGPKGHSLVSTCHIQEISKTKPNGFHTVILLIHDRLLMINPTWCSLMLWITPGWERKSQDIIGCFTTAQPDAPASKWWQIWTSNQAVSVECSCSGLKISSLRMRETSEVWFAALLIWRSDGSGFENWGKFIQSVPKGAMNADECRKSAFRRRITLAL